jgi:uncharacterized protein YuzE
MNDFEVHNTGHFEEIRLSRELANAIELEVSTYGQVMPFSVMQAYQRLKKHYEWQIEHGVT